MTRVKLNDLNRLPPDFIAQTPTSRELALLSEQREFNRTYSVRRKAGLAQGCRAFGLEEMKICYHYLLGAETLGEELQRLRRFYLMVRERLQPGFFRVRKNVHTVKVEMDFPWHSDNNEELETAALLTTESLTYFFKWSVDQDIAIEKIGLPYHANPSHTTRLEQLSEFVVFEQPHIWITFSPTYLKTSIVRSFHEIDDFLALLSHYRAFGFKKTDTDRDYIKRIIIESIRYQEYLPRLEEISALLNQSPATLKRRLQRHGTNYREIVTECRLEEATQMLRRGMAIKEIAYALGYQDQNAFRRAFKTWSGVQPGKWRNQLS